MTARALVLGVLAAAGLAACGASTDGAAKAGAPPGRVVLRLGTPSGNAAPAVQAFVEAVERRSGGGLRVEVVPAYGGSGPDAEARVVRGVARGAVGLGWVRSGVLDAFDVPSLRALTAPMLITSYGAETAVLRSELGGAMLVGVGAAGVTGLALLADGLQRPFGVSGPLLGPADYRGLRIGAYQSRATAAALGALGATTTSLWGGQLLAALDDGRVDGFERSLRIYAEDAMAGTAPYATANVVLWPQVLVLIANPKTLAGLSAEQRRWLKAAAGDASAASVGLVRDEAPLVETACEQGGRFSSATPAQIRQLRAAFAHTLAGLERDPSTRASIARIRTLVAGVPQDASPAIPPDCMGSPPGGLEVTGRSTPLDGVYRWTISDADARHDPNYTPGAPDTGTAVFTLTLTRERWRLQQRSSDGSPEQIYRGSFQVQGNRVTFAWSSAGAVDVFRIKRTRDGLRLAGLRGNPGDLFVWGHNPWHNIK
jgi:TRAP-type C4-dicarboxylate transport system substrate-binding protein